MPVTPSGALSVPQAALRLMLADCAAARTWLGAADQAAALARIHYDGLPAPANGAEYTLEELTTYRPYAVIYTPDRRGLVYHLDAISTHSEFRRNGAVCLRLYNSPDETDNDEPTSEANLKWKNTLGAILDGLADLAGTVGASGSYLAFDVMKLEEGPSWGHPKRAKTDGVYQWAEISFDWHD
jgi:hypothetical protein